LLLWSLFIKLYKHHTRFPSLSTALLSTEANKTVSRVIPLDKFGFLLFSLSEYVLMDLHCLGAMRVSVFTHMASAIAIFALIPCSHALFNWYESLRAFATYAPSSYSLPQGGYGGYTYPGFGPQPTQSPPPPVSGVATETSEPSAAEYNSRFCKFSCLNVLSFAHMKRNHSLSSFVPPSVVNGRLSIRHTSIYSYTYLRDPTYALGPIRHFSHT
jgi:hypothetical protein